MVKAFQLLESRVMEFFIAHEWSFIFRIIDSNAKLFAAETCPRNNRGLMHLHGRGLESNIFSII